MLTRTLLLLDEGKGRPPRKRRGSGKGRVLYHIGKRPASPKPAHSQAARYTGRKGQDETPEGKWERPGIKPTKSGVFLTNNPHRVATKHGVHGHVYAYRVPEHVIHKSGGIRTFDNATELLVPHDHWHHVEFLGKKMDKKKFGKEIQSMPMHIFTRNSDRTDAAWDKKRAERQDTPKTEWIEPLRTALLGESLRIRRQSVKERMSKKRPSATFGAKRAAKWLWQQQRKKWSKAHPQYIFRKGKLIFIPPEKKRQLRSKIKGRIVMRASLPGSGSHG